MTKENYLLFLEKLIEATKSRKILWERDFNKQLTILESITSPIKPVLSKSFISKPTPSLLRVRLTYFSDDHIELHISYDPTLSEVCYFGDDCDVAVLIMRLHNLVYSLFPNAEKAIIDFIQSI